MHGQHCICDAGSNCVAKGRGACSTGHHKRGLQHATRFGRVDAVHGFNPATCPQCTCVSGTRAQKTAMFAWPCKETNYQIKNWLIKGELGFSQVNDAAQHVDEVPLEPWDLMYGGGCRSDWLRASKIPSKVLMTHAPMQHTPD